jgi:hypothetical protein
MGVKHGREYTDIMTDLTRGLAQVKSVYAFFEMNEEDWVGMEPSEQEDCLRTLADDVFYGLGTEPVMHVGGGVIRHDKEHHTLRVHDGENLISIVYLI